MSDTDLPIDSSAASAPSPAPSPSGEPSRSRGRRLASGLWRWSRRLALAAVFLLLIGRVTMGLWLPKVAQRAVAPYGLHVSWQDFDLSVLGLSLDLVGVRIVPLPEADASGETSSPSDAELAQIPPLLRLDDLGLDADVSALLTGDLRVHRVEVSGLEAWLARDAAGRWNYERHLPEPSPDEGRAAEAEADEDTEDTPQDETSEVLDEAPEAPAPLDFSSPVQISTINLAGVRLHLRDDLAAPALDTALDLDVTVRDVGHPERPIQARAVAHAAEILDALVLTAEAEMGLAKLLVDLDLRADGLGVRRLAPYLEPFGISPVANKLNAVVAAKVDLAPVQSAVNAEESDAPVTDLGGFITLAEVRIDADGEPAVRIDETTIKVRRARSALFDLESAVCSGLTAQATRLPGGAFRAAGLDFVGAPPKPEEPEQPEDPEESASGPAPTLRLERLALESVRLTLIDQSFVDPRQLEATVSAEITSIVLDAAAPGTPLQVRLNASLKDAGALSLTGSAVPTGETLSADLELMAEDVTLNAVAPYLTAAGVQSTLEEGALYAGISFQMIPGDADLGESSRIQASINEISVRDGDTQHLSLAEMALDGMELLPDGSTTVRRVGLAGGSIPVDVFPGGAFRGFGLESLGLDPGATGRRLGLNGATIDVTDLAFGGEGSRASIEGSFDLLGLVQGVQVDGSILTRDGPLDLEASVSLIGSGVHLEGLEDFLAAEGIEPDFEDGVLKASAEVSLKAGASEGSTLMEARVFNLALMNRGVEALAVDEARVAGFESGPDGTSIREVLVSGPRVAVSRDSTGVLALAGLRIGVAPSGVNAIDPAAAEARSESVDIQARPTESPGEVAASSEAGTDEATSAPFTIERVGLEELAITWSDASVAPEVQTAIRARAEVLDIDLSSAPTSKPVRLTLEAGLDGALDSLVLEAAAERGAKTQGLEGSLNLAGLKAGPLASYLPPGMLLILEDGRVAANFQASSEPADDGGSAIRASIEGFDYRDGPESESLLAFRSLQFDAPRLDSEGAFFAVETVALEDLIFDAERTAADRIEVLGLALVSLPAEAPEDGADQGANEEQESVPQAPAKDDAEAGADAQPPAPPPTVTLGRVDVGIERFRYIDRTRADAIPLDLSLALVTPGPQTLCLPDPLDLPPIAFSAVGKVDPIIERIDITAGLEPFAADPGASLKLLIGGITGSELVRIAPEVAATMDPSAYKDGSVEAAADLRLALARKGPLDFSLDRGFGAVLSIDQFAIKENPEAAATGFERLDVEVKRVDPATGDVRIASIDLSGIYARVHQAVDGTTVAGLRFPPAPAEAAEEPSNQDLDVTEVDVTEVEETVPEPASETSIDRLTISGLDFEFLDTTVEPALRLPIADLQLEVKRFTTRTLTEPVPFAFEAVIDAGTVELQERTGIDNLLFGVLNSAASAVTPGSSEFKLEPRRVWDLLEAKGRLSLGPETRGRTQLTLLGLELPAFRGAARSAGVEIGDGLLDNRTSLRFREDGAMSIDTKTTTSYLSLSEPPGGPISEYLSLPAPLDTVLFLLRNDSGEQKLPVRLDIPEGGVSATQIAGLAANTLGVLITDAVSSAPLRVLGPLGSVAGALGLTEAPLTAETVTLEFTDGAATMVAATAVEASESAPGTDPLAQIEKALRGNPNLRVVVQAELGAGDIEVARRLANPSRESIDSLIERNRGRKAELERERAKIAARAKAQIFAGSATDLVAQLQSLDAERAAVEQALDALFAYIRPGAERRAEMRTRNAALALASQRLERVRLDLVDRVGLAASQRVDIRRARFRKGTEDNPLPPRGRVTITPK